MKYPVYRPKLGGKEKEYVMECLDSTWISSKGKFVSKFEEEFASFIGSRHATAVSNGTVALHLALLALGVGPGDEVIVPTFTYIASVNAITYTGATPVFVDSLESTWQMDPKDVERKITGKTKAIMVVHLYGHPCDMDALCAITRDRNLYMIEDCAEAIGSKYKGRYVGTFGDIATFSFYGNKTITTGEGGMVLTDDETMYDRAVHFKGQGLAKHRQYWHDVIGYNYRMTNICAAIGLAQLENIEQILSRKRSIANWYKEKLDPVNGVSTHGEAEDAHHSYWMCSLLLDDPELRKGLRNHLDDKGIETRPLFYPIHTMPMYSSKFHSHKVAENLGWRGINLPSYPELEESDVDYITSAIKEFMDGRS